MTHVDYLSNPYIETLSKNLWIMYGRRDKVHHCNTVYFKKNLCREGFFC